ncbi:PilW family protein [Psychromonas ossibalaenae]|uniref:PilW family protein n=1 Tax=Psychromonas ossibalaenae TaxID=444922 RepID=UPI00036B9B99|nr:prepilin-type N-terminal cleavage/methylation domain-containing protein [Psychromonas ossibalaenae]
MKFKDVYCFKRKIQQTGFTLVELLIAMLISLFLVLGTTILYSSLKSSIKVAQDLATAQESLRGAFYLMSRSVRQAEDFDIPSSSALTTFYGTPPVGSPIYNCLGKSISGSTNTDTYTLLDNDLYCNDGTDEELIALGVTELAFQPITGTNDDGLKVTMKIEGMPASDSYENGFTFTLALRQKILLDLSD